MFAVLPDQDVQRAYAGVALPNDASVALHERFGFREIGTYVEDGVGERAQQQAFGRERLVDLEQPAILSCRASPLTGVPG